MWPSVALLAEGVDRNMERRVQPEWRVPSPSSRRAWIEIILRFLLPPIGSVALLAEGVDRNVRHSWIWALSGWVALLAEGVDRN